VDNLTHYGFLDSTSDSSRRSRRCSAETGENELHIIEEQEENPKNEKLLKSYTKIWDTVIAPKV